MSKIVQIEKELIKIVNHILNKSGKKPIENLTPEMRLREELGFDSLDLAELTVRIEDLTGIDIFEDGIVLTIGDILKKIGGNDHGISDKV